MKIIQLLARIEGSGVTKYTIEFNKGLIKCGHDVELVYLNPNLKNGNTNLTNQTIDNIVEYNWSEDTLKHINEADLVIVNSIIDKKSPNRDLWIDWLQNKITTKKVIVINDHKSPGFRAYYGDLLKRKDFWLSFNKICTFGYDANVYKDIRKIIGEGDAKKRFMQLIHPFNFDDSIKEKWESAETKLKRLCYFGRHSTFKDEVRLLRARDYFWEHGYELEMRGVRCVINLITIQDFKYKVDPETHMPITKDPYVKGFKYELSPYTYWCDDTKDLRKKLGASLTDLMIDSPKREPNKIYIFGAYKHEDGMEMMRRYAFSCDFYNLDTPECYGNNIEYTIFEMVQYGSIPLMDTGAGNSIHILGTDGNFTDDTLVSKTAGIFLDKELSDINQCISQMNLLYYNKDMYDEYRNNIYNVFKQHSNPETIINKFLTDINN